MSHNIFVIKFRSLLSAYVFFAIYCYDSIIGNKFMQKIEHLWQKVKCYSALLCYLLLVCLCDFLVPEEETIHKYISLIALHIVKNLNN